MAILYIDGSKVKNTSIINYQFDPDVSCLVYIHTSQDFTLTSLIMSSCSAILKSGPNKGKACGKTACKNKAHNSATKNIADQIYTQGSTDMYPSVPVVEANVTEELYTSIDTISESKIITSDSLTSYCSDHSIKITRKMQDDEKKYLVLGAHMLIRVSADDKMLFLWPISEKLSIALIHYINSIGLEAHEIILIDHCRMFMDIDIVLSSKQYTTQLNKFESEDHLTGAIIDAYEQACNLSIQAHGYTEELSYKSATRIRPIDGDQIKIGIHIVVDAWMPISYAKYIANDMRKQLKVINSDLPEKMLVDGIDAAPYRMRGSLSLPGGTKGGVKLETDGSDISAFFISRQTENTPVLNKLDIKITEYQPHEINNDFIKEALQHVHTIPDWSDAFDLDASSLKGNNMIVRRVSPSHCSVCDRTHNGDNTMRLNFANYVAFWKCSRAPEGTKAKVWYKGEEAKGKKERTVGGKPIDILRADLLEICKNRYRRVEQSGAIYERKYDYYYTHKFDDPAPFLTHIFRDNELYSTSSSTVHKELLYFIKHIVHPDFEFIKHDYDYIGFTNGVYDLSTATFIPTDELDKTIQVRKLFNQEYKIAATPLIDAYLKYQFHEDDIEFIYFLLGRSMTRLADHFDFMLLLFGQGGSGKSLLMKLISSCFASNQVGILSSSFQGQFGLCEFANRQLVCSDDMPSNLAKTLDKGDFLKMMTRGAISCPVKGKGSIEVHDWNIPTIINSNSLPNYKDISGEIVRRVMVLNFENVIPEDQRNTSLESDIIQNEISTFIHKCRSTYLEYKVKYHGKGVETFCPQVFLENRKLLRLAANNTCAFINERFEYSNESSDTMTIPALNKLFKVWMKDRYSLQKNSSENINAQSIESLDARMIYKRMNTCKYCRSEHKKGCCSKYARTDRSKCEVITNIIAKTHSDDPSMCEAFQSKYQLE